MNKRIVISVAVLLLLVACILLILKPGKEIQYSVQNLSGPGKSHFRVIDGKITKIKIGERVNANDKLYAISSDSQIMLKDTKGGEQVVCPKNSPYVLRPPKQESLFTKLMSFINDPDLEEDDPIYSIGRGSTDALETAQLQTNHVIQGVSLKIPSFKEKPYSLKLSNIVGNKNIIFEKTDIQADIFEIPAEYIKVGNFVLTLIYSDNNSKQPQKRDLVLEVHKEPPYPQLGLPEELKTYPQLQKLFTCRKMAEKKSWQFFASSYCAGEDTEWLAKEYLEGNYEVSDYCD